MNIPLSNLRSPTKRQLVAKGSQTNKKLLRESKHPVSKQKKKAEDSVPSEESESLFDAEPSTCLFSLDDDHRLVKGRCFDPQSSWDNLERDFVNVKSNENTSDNYRAFTREVLEKRLEELTHDNALIHRFQFLIIEIEKSKMTGSGLRDEYLHFSAPKHTSKDAESGNMSQTSPKAQIHRGQRIQVVVKGRNFAQYTKNATLQSLVQASSLIAASVARDTENERFPLQMSHTDKEAVEYYLSSNRLIIDENSSRYDDIQTFGHLEEPVISRFLTFIEDPTIVERRKTMHDVSKNKKMIEDSVQKGLVFSIVAEKDKHLRSIHSQQEEELTRIEAVLEKAMEEDIRNIREQHQLTIAVERGKLKAKYASVVQQIEEFYCTQELQAIQKLRQLAADTQSVEPVASGEISGKSTLAEKAVAFGSNKLVQDVDSMFANDNPLRLLLLAEDFEVPALRSACVDFITYLTPYTKYAFRQEISSPFIADTTLLSIVQSLTSEQLLGLLQDAARVPHRSLLESEVNSRKLLLAGQLQDLSNEHMREILAVVYPMKNSEKDQAMGGSHLAIQSQYHQMLMRGKLDELVKECKCYPEVLVEELNTRKEYSRVVINEDILTPQIVLGESHLSVQLEDPHLYAVAMANTGRCAGQFGRWLFEVTIEAMDSVGGTVSVGWDVSRKVTCWRPERGSGEAPRGSLKTFGCMGSYGMIIPGLTPDDTGAAGIMWQSDGKDVNDPQDGCQGVGMLQSFGRSRSGYPTFGVGDVIGCVIDQNAAIPYVRFYKNGEQIIPSPGMTITESKEAHNVNAGAQPGSLLSDTSLGGGVLIKDRDYHLFPAVCMYSTRRGAITRLRFNFHGPFSYSVPMFEPYGTHWPKDLGKPKSPSKP